MVDVLVESYNSNIKRTLGGCSYDGNMKILDQYGQNANGAKGTYLSWILFGDPCLTLRNAVPTDMGVTHASTMSSSATSFTVNATNGNGALATLTCNNEIMGSATINNGTCNITFAAPGTTGTATLTVFGYNKITYIGTVNITSGGSTQYNVTVSANPTNGGTVTGGGTYNQGQSCTVTATANAGYTFTNWTENGSVVSTQASYTFSVNNNRNLVANFQAQTLNYTITVSAAPRDGGTVTGGGTYQQGQSCTVSATPNTGYTFTNWTENGTVVSTNASYTFIVNNNRTLVANFQTQSFTITATADPANGGTASGGGSYDYGQTCHLSATANTGYRFFNWTENGVHVTSVPDLSFTVTSNRNLVAHFELEDYFITAAANPTEGGIVTGDGAYNYNQSCTLTATPNEGYDFLNWTENGTVVSSDATYTFNVTGDRTLVANFELQTFEVRVSIKPEEAGSVTGGGTYNYGEEVTLTVVRNENWAFQNWTEDGEVVSEETTYVFIITSDRDLDANFIYAEGVGENSSSAKVYPNPTKGEITLEGEGLNHVRIINTYGQMVYNAKVEGEQVRIDLSNMAKGIYMMHIEAYDGQVVRKIVVE